MPKITYCILTMNRLEELQRAVRHHAPAVDRTIIIDGCSTDGTVEWLESEECKKLNVEYKCIKQKLFQYGNHNPDKRNPYLEMAGDDGWILCLDDDELLYEDVLSSLRPLATGAERNGYDGVKFKPHDIWYKEDGSILRDIKHPDYWSPMFWKSYPGQHYRGHTHVRIVRPRARERWFESDSYYKHIKDERRLWRNSTQNYWTTVGLAQNNTDDKTWSEFHDMMKCYGFYDWHVLDEKMKEGNLPEEITDWFIEHKEAENPEERSWFVWYCIFLHPEENKNKISNRDYQWDYTCA